MFSFTQSNRIIVILSFIFLATTGLIFSQQENVVESWDKEGYGFYLKKVVSNTTTCSGQTFSYTIYFSFPAGTQTVTITDNLPNSLVFHSISVTNVCGTPSVSTPPPGTSGTVTVSFASIPPGGCSGSMTLVVSFPNGITCNGTTARNRVCIEAGYRTPGAGLIPIGFCTPYVSTTAQATNTWQVEKKILGASWQGGSCPWKFGGDTATYVICVYKNNPSPCGTNGQLNLVNAEVYETLPAGAQFVSSTPSVSVNGNVITWNVGGMSATQPYNKQCCTLKVYYPPAQFPSGTQITNSATLTGELGSPNSPCGSFSQTSSVCWEKVLPPPPITSASIFKWGSTNGQPGCAGSYYILFCNTGSTTLPAGSVTIRDTLPVGLTLTNVTPSPSTQWIVTTSGTIITSTNNAPLAPGNCSYPAIINFTISPTATPNTTITNCAWAFVQGLAPLKSCWSFVVNAPSPKACVQKQICNQQSSYLLGQTIRFRFRLQNIGGQAISGATITDNLNSNFQYIGNPTFYVSNSWNVPCNPSIGTGGITAWNPSPSLSVSGQTITIGNISIPASCQDVFWNGCGWYGIGTVPYYWIEFDVKIVDTAGLGNIPNSFTISGGGLAAPETSNTVLVLTTGTTGFNLNKEVASDTSNWGSTLTVSPGALYNYRLQMNVSGNVPLRHVTFVDLLPRDAGTMDYRILPSPCVPRGSQFDVTYQGQMLLNPPATLFSNTISQASANGIAQLTLFPTSCGTSTAWVSGAPTGSKNIGIYFTNAIGGGGTATAVLQAKASDSATAGQIACNSFAAGGAVLHYLNSSTATDVAVSPLESGNICIAIDSSSKCYSAQVVQFPSVIGQTQKGCKYRMVVSLNNPGATTLSGCAFSPDGSIIPNTFGIPPGSSTVVFQFIDTPPANNVACIYFGVQDNAGACLPCDTVCVDLPPCPTDTCCPERVQVRIKCLQQDANGNWVYQISASGVFTCDSSYNPITLSFSTPYGTLSPSIFTLTTPSTFNITTNFTGPLSPGSVMTLYYTIYGNGLVLCKDSARIKLPECPPQTQGCCGNFGINLQSVVAKWYPSGLVAITGGASALLPLQRFTATIVSAQRKIGFGPWQRIFGDFVSGMASSPPLPLSFLTPFSRELVWGDSCTQQITPGTFKLLALFPPPPAGFKKDSLKFMIRYAFTDCKCQTCDTLVTYNVVRWKKIIFYPWEVVNVKPVAKNLIRVSLPTKARADGDTTTAIQLTAIEFASGGGNQISGRLLGLRSEKDLLAIANDGRVVLVIPSRNGDEEIELELENISKFLKIRYHYREEGSDAYGIEEQEIPVEEVVSASASIVQDDQKVDGVRTFGLAIVNRSDVPVSGVELTLTPRPQSDGTVPNIIGVGRPGSSELVIRCCWEWRPGCRCSMKLTEDMLDAYGSIRTLYITVSGSTLWREKKDQVELDYELRTTAGVVIGSGTVLLEGAVSGIKEFDDGSGSTLTPHISAIVPNPAMEKATVSLWFPSELNAVQLEVYDSIGTLVNKKFLTNLNRGTTAVELDLNTLPSGAYQVVLRTSLGVSNYKLVIVR